MPRKHTVAKRLFLFLLFILGFSAKAQGANIAFSLTKDKYNYAILLPDNLISEYSNVTVHSADGELKAKLYISSWWPRVGNERFVRKIDLRIEPTSLIGTEQYFYYLKHKPSRIKLPTYFGSTASIQLINPTKTNWLHHVFITQPISTFKEVDTINHAQSWYSKTQRLEANFIKSSELMNSRGYGIQQSAQWLFDRPRALYQLYFQTGAASFLLAANNAAKMYMSRMNANGFYKEKPRDHKYLAGMGLFYYYLINGDKSAAGLLQKMYQASLTWEPAYKPNRGFWTERHQAAVLDIAVTNWLLTGDNVIRARIDYIVDVTYQMTFNRTKKQDIQCPAHKMSAHEGNRNNSLVCSPWMMALLTDGLWRYWLKTQSEKAAKLIVGFGRFVAGNGLYSTQIKDRTTTLPYYLVNLDNHQSSMKNKWTDGQHACDISGMLGKAVFVSKYYQYAHADTQNAFSLMLDECQYLSNKIVSSSSKRGYAPVMPPRKFGWKYSTTAELPYFEALFKHHD